MRSLRDSLILEGTLQVRSAWALVLVGLLIGALLLGSYSALGWAEGMRPALESIRQQEGDAFSSWLLHDDQALAFRNDLSMLQPAMGANLYLTIAGAFGPLLAAIFGARAIGSEFGQRTARVRAANSGWTRVIAHKQIVVVMAALVAAGIVPLVGILAGRVTWSLFAARMPDLSSISLAALPFSPLLGALAVACGMALYGLLGCLIALVTRSTAAGIVFGVAIPYVEGYVGAWWLPRAACGYLLNRWLGYYDGSFIVAPGVAHPPGSLAAALAVMGLWLAALVGGALLFSRHQEIA